MKNDGMITIRLPRALLADIERRRKKASVELGSELTSSVIVRGLLEQALRGKRGAA